MSLGAKNKLGFISGKITKPLSTAENYDKWYRNNSMLRCWLTASVSAKIAEQMLICNSAKEFWDELEERYGQSNAPQLYMIKKELNAFELNNMSVSEYFGRWKGFWDELGSLEGFPECTCGALGKCSCDFMKKLLERDEKNK
ncbi:uncharacterized protein LOC109135969 [Beta vulgaris subsp. vulgaris]|uniref:uncharacterized protein LOC109135969 n=1 Tax=Beta vulgaris subsp. vulgaris TaxID=3555 RepID=UPI002037128B|nr:uncharacterized protein LOC109135969 [Beta vulgaris subsp. vulgaris]